MRNKMDDDYEGEPEVNDLDYDPEVSLDWFDSSRIPDIAEASEALTWEELDLIIKGKRI